MAWTVFINKRIDYMLIWHNISMEKMGKFRQMSTLMIDTNGCSMEEPLHLYPWPQLEPAGMTSRHAIWTLAFTHGAHRDLAQNEWSAVMTNTNTTFCKTQRNKTWGSLRKICLFGQHLLQFCMEPKAFYFSISHVPKACIDIQLSRLGHFLTLGAMAPSPLPQDQPRHITCSWC